MGNQINLYFKGLKEDIAEQKAKLEKAVADWDKIFDDEKVKEGDFTFAISDDELSWMESFDDEAIISYLRYGKQEPNSMGLFDSTICDYKRKEITGPLTDAEQALYNKLKEIEDDYQKNGTVSSIYFTYQIGNKEFSIIRENLNINNSRVLLEFSLQEAPNEEDSEDTGIRYLFEVVAESDSRLTTYDILVALGVPETASKFLEFKECIKEKFSEQMDDD